MTSPSLSVVVWPQYSPVTSATQVKSHVTQGVIRILPDGMAFALRTAVRCADQGSQAGGKGMQTIAVQLDARTLEQAGVWRRLAAARWGN